MIFGRYVLRFSICFFLSAGSVLAQGDPVRVIVTLPTVQALVEEVGGERVDVTALARGDQDPHFVSPTPVLMRRVREADIFIENGFSLERWADDVANGSGNSNIYRGTAGRVIAGTGIAAMEIPSVLSRELGDIHPQGNPHVWLDPLLAKVQAKNIAESLGRVDPAGADYYSERLSNFEQRIDRTLFGDELVNLIGIQKLTRLAWTGELHEFLMTNQLGGQPLIARASGWLEQAEALHGIQAYEFHRVWVYFARVFGIELVGTIEERPGIPPGPQHVRQVRERIQATDIPLILVDNFYDPALANNIAQDTNAVVVSLPNQVLGEPGIETYFDLMDHLITQITAALARRSD